MSLLLEIQREIDAVTVRIRALEEAIVLHPGLPSVAANLESMSRMLRRLDQEFVEAANSLGVEVCRYRAFDVSQSTKPAAAFRAIADFQKLFSVVYGAIRHGIKQRATIPEYLAKETNFGLGYAFTGSVGVVLTAPHDSTLFSDPGFSESIAAIFEMARAEQPDEVAAFAGRLGPGPVHALFEWARENANNRLGADIKWQSSKSDWSSLFVQPQELSRLTKIIERTSAKKSDEMTCIGMLQAADVPKRKFKMSREGLPEIRGTVADGVIDEKHTVGLPRRYKAFLRRTITTQYATGQETTRYLLLRLEQP